MNSSIEYDAALVAALLIQEIADEAIPPQLLGKIVFIVVEAIHEANRSGASPEPSIN